MNMFLFFFVNFLVLIYAQNCTWGTWTAWSQCSDTCGNCGNQSRTRQCSPATCTCAGNTTETEVCGNDICIFPRQSCCSGEPASLLGQFKCS